MTQRLLPALAVLGALAFAGCSTGGGAPAAEQLPLASQSDPAPADAAEVDRTAELGAAHAGAPWLPAVTAAIETEPGRMQVATSIVDPRVDGSGEAAMAVEVCRAAVTLLESSSGSATYVSVLEQDGTTFVVYTLQGASAGGCAEV